MPSFHAHHCPICSRIGDKRCLNLEHYLDCTIHPGNYHSKQSDCIKCVEAERREKRKEARDQNKENQDPAAVKKANKKANKKTNKGRAKPLHEMTIKELRRELRRMPEKEEQQHGH